MESTQGKRVPKILHRLKKKLNLKQVWGDIKDFETFEVMYGQLFIIEFFAILRKKKSAKKVINRANISSPDMNSFQS